MPGMRRLSGVMQMHRWLMDRGSGGAMGAVYPFYMPVG